MEAGVLSSHVTTRQPPPRRVMTRRDGQEQGPIVSVQGLVRRASRCIETEVDDWDDEMDRIVTLSKGGVSTPNRRRRVSANQRRERHASGCTTGTTGPHYETGQTEKGSSPGWRLHYGAYDQGCATSNTLRERLQGSASIHRTPRPSSNQALNGRATSLSSWLLLIVSVGNAALLY